MAGKKVGPPLFEKSPKSIPHSQGAMFLELLTQPDAGWFWTIDTSAPRIAVSLIYPLRDGPTFNLKLGHKMAEF